jgi:hypothetical protein
MDASTTTNTYVAEWKPGKFVFFWQIMGFKNDQNGNTCKCLSPK